MLSIGPPENNPSKKSAGGIEGYGRNKPIKGHVAKKQPFHDPSPNPRFRLVDHAFGGFDDRNDGFVVHLQKSFQKNHTLRRQEGFVWAFPSGSSIGDASAVSWIRTELSPKNRKQPPLCQNKPTYCNPNKKSGRIQ